DLVGSIPGQAVGTTGRLARALEAIAIQLGESYDAATFDRLTGVNNRQALLAELFTEVERANRYNRPFSVAFVDIDHFKQVNDTYGHHAGDIVLRGVAQAIRANLRVSDMIGRYGGEEFLLLLTETSVDDATNLTEKLRILIERQTFTVDRGQAVSVTVSIGIAGGVGRALRLDALVRDADAAMYSAKSLGRNQTYVFAEPDEDARVPRAPISPAGRSHALAVGKAAREAATAALTSVIAPLPHYRGQPSALIAHIAMTIGARLDLPQAEIEKLRIAALLHDLGKVAVPEEILEKPGSLTSEEWRSVVQHPRIGQVILEQATVLRDAVPIVLHHHERYSGHGYPYGLRGNDIPLGARIVAIADAYDAMISDRPYKRAISHEQAVRELQRHAGTQFDPELVDIFCDLYAETPPQVEAHGSQPGLEHLLAIAAAAGDRATDPAPPAVAAGTAGPEPDAAADEAPGYRRQRAGRPRLGETPAGRSPKRRSSPTAARSASSNRADRRTQSEGPAAAAS
ncbi:MAG TPA: diguanylate cyclase, partial [Candidatus Limnocylindrales bacterium]